MNEIPPTLAVFRLRKTILSALCVFACVSPGRAAAPVPDQKVRLKESPLTLMGRVSKSKAISTDPARQGSGEKGYYQLIDQRFKYYFVPLKHVRSIEEDAFQGTESFKLKHKSAARSRIPDYIGGFSNVTPFDNRGVRTVTLDTPNGPKQVIQAISELRTQYAWLRSLNHKWEYGIPITSLESDVLDKVLKNAVDMTDPLERLDVCRYLSAAGKLELARAWIQRVEQEFPAHKKQCKAATLRLDQIFYAQVVDELKQRKRAGQHRLVQLLLPKIPSEGVSQQILNEVEQLKKEYKVKQIAIRTILGHLEQLETIVAADDAKLAANISPFRAELKQHLGFSSLDRLQAYINLSKDETLKPAQRLALAYSGWLLGSANAITNIQETMGLWSARGHIAIYLNTDDRFARQKALDELDRLEGASPRAVAQLLSTSPPLDPAVVPPGKFVPFTVNTPNGPASYKAILPPEYSPYHDYPMIVTLRQANVQAETAMVWWAGTEASPLQAQRRGYIVIAPEYLAPGATTYVSNPRTHEIVLASVRDAFSRFSIDTDRVFLSGHGSGADAAFDTGMTHPDMFAGVIPICGFVTPACTKLTTNGAKVPWYVVSGQRHRESLAHNSFVLHQMAITKRNEHVLVCEYRDRGFETYYDEVQNIFTWMENYAREPMPAEFEVATVRPENNQWYWIEASGFGKVLKNQDFNPATRGRKALKSVEYSLKVSTKNTIQIKRAGAGEITLRLMDDVIDFEKSARVSLRRSGKVDLKPAVADVLEDYRIYRDRHRIALQRYKL